VHRLWYLERCDPQLVAASTSPEHTWIRSVLPVLIVLLLRLVNSRRLMGQWTNSRLQNGLAWGLAGVIAAATLVLLLSPFISGV
jgi:hypothetical protein